MLSLPRGPFHEIKFYEFGDNPEMAGLIFSLYIKDSSMKSHHMDTVLLCFKTCPEGLNKLQSNIQNELKSIHFEPVRLEQTYSCAEGLYLAKIGTKPRREKPTDSTEGTTRDNTLKLLEILQRYGLISETEAQKAETTITTMIDERRFTVPDDAPKLPRRL